MRKGGGELLGEMGKERGRGDGDWRVVGCAN